MAGRDIVLDVIERRRGDALKQEAAELDKLANKAEVSGHSMRKMGDESSALSRRIEEQTTKVRALASEIERGGGTDKGLLSQFRTAERDLDKLKRVGKVLEDMVPEVGAAGAKVGTSFMSGLGNAIEGGIPGEVKAALIGMGVVLAVEVAPIIGAAISGAVVGAVGIGGIIGGVAAAAQDPAVKAAAGGLKSVLMGEFTDSGRQFVQPTIDAIEILKNAARDIDLTHMLAPLAAEVPVLAQGLADMARAMEPGLSRAFAAAAPAIAAMADRLPEIGQAFGDMLGNIAESKGAIEGLVMMLDVASGVLLATGDAVAWLSDRFNDVLGIVIPVGRQIAVVLAALEPTWTGLNGMLDRNVEHWQQWRDAAGGTMAAAVHAAAEAAASVSRLGAAQAGAATEADKLADANAIAANSIHGLHSAQLAALSSTLNATAALIDFKQAVKDHGASLKDSTQAGINNQIMLVGLADKYAVARDNAIKNGVETGKANSKYMDQINRLQELAGKLGMNKDKVWELIGAYKSVPAGPFTTTFIQKYITQGTPGEHSGGRIVDIRPDPKKKKALGGPVKAGESYVVGDGGRPEWFVPDQDGYVHPRVPSSAMSGAASAAFGGGGSMSSASGGSFAPLTVHPGSVAAVLVTLLQDAIRTQYGGNVVLALGSR